MANPIVTPLDPGAGGGEAFARGTEAVHASIGRAGLASPGPLGRAPCRHHHACFACMEQLADMARNAVARHRAGAPLRAPARMRALHGVPHPLGQRPRRTGLRAHHHASAQVLPLRALRPSHVHATARRGSRDDLDAEDIRRIPLVPECPSLLARQVHGDISACDRAA